MPAKKIITVLGATGAQGGGLARTILADPSGGFAVRAVTREPTSEKARALAYLGAEVVEGDIGDPACLRRAFEGAHGAYCLTLSCASLSPETELTQARRLAEAARDAGVKHVIHSTLNATSEASASFTRAGLPTTFLLPSFYWENFFSFGLVPQPDDRLALTLPLGDRKLPGIAAEDIGRCAYGIFQRGTAMVGRTIGVAGQHLTGEEMAAALASMLARPVGYQAVTLDAFRSRGIPSAIPLTSLFQHPRAFDAEFCATRSIGRSLALHPGLRGFRAWLAGNRQHFVAAAGNQNSLNPTADLEVKCA